MDGKVESGPRGGAAARVYNTLRDKHNKNTHNEEMCEVKSLSELLVVTVREGGGVNHH